MDITRWSVSKSEWLYSWSRRWSQQKLAGSYHELLVAKFRLKLRKVGRSTRLWGYDLNQIPYEYTVEVINWLNRSDLIECLKNYGQRFVTVQVAVIKTIPKKKKCIKAKWLSEEVLQIAEKRREVKGKGEKERYTQSEFTVPKNSKER